MPTSPPVRRAGLGMTRQAWDPAGLWALLTRPSRGKRRTSGSSRRKEQAEGSRPCRGTDRPRPHTGRALTLLVWEMGPNSHHTGCPWRHARPSSRRAPGPRALTSTHSRAPTSHGALACPFVPGLTCPSAGGGGCQGPGARQGLTMCHMENAVRVPVSQSGQGSGRDRPRLGPGGRDSSPACSNPDLRRPPHQKRPARLGLPP